jgi:ABC-2 type transport system ATP-binding protein
MMALVEAMDVSMAFGTVRAVDHVDLTVESGEVVGLLGANGAGKTTLIRVLLGLLAPTGGRVRVLGGRPSMLTRQLLGYMPQGLGLYEDLTVAENLTFQASVFGVSTPRLDDDLAAVADVVVADLPLGLRRRVAFAAALGHGPRLLVLDEPTSGVGPLGRAALWDTIRAAADDGVGVLVTTHAMDEAEQCDRLVVLAAGREVASGTVADITRGREVVQLRPADLVDALGMLEEAGLVVVPAGATLRVVGADPVEVQRVLGDRQHDDLQVVPATLEEAFVAAVMAVPGAA